MNDPRTRAPSTCGTTRIVSLDSSGEGRFSGAPGKSYALLSWGRRAERIPCEFEQGERRPGRRWRGMMRLLVGMCVGLFIGPRGERISARPTERYRRAAPGAVCLL